MLTMCFQIQKVSEWTLSLIAQHTSPIPFSLKQVSSWRRMVTYIFFYIILLYKSSPLKNKN